jgi:hypothetical protein
MTARDTRLCTPLSATVLRITFDMLGFGQALGQVRGPVSLLLETPDALASQLPPMAVFEAKGIDGGTGEVSFCISPRGS